MRHADPTLQQTARRWLALEARGNRSPHALVRAASGVQGRLTSTLGRTIGELGVTALFARSVRLVRAEHPCLKDLAASASDLAEPLRICLEAYEQEVVWEVAETLLSTFLEVLMSLLGEKLTLRLVHDAWPSEPATSLEGTQTP